VSVHHGIQRDAERRMHLMHRKLLKPAMIGLLAVFLVLFMAVGAAEEEWTDERTDATGQWRYVLEAMARR